MNELGQQTRRPEKKRIFFRGSNFLGLNFYFFRFCMIFSIALCTVALLPTPVYAMGVAYYVATFGNDSSSGTSISTPWGTVQKALNTAGAGDTVYIMAGTYYEKPVVNVSGSDGNLITIMNYNGDMVYIDGAGVTNEYYFNGCLFNNLFTIDSRHHLKIQGITFQNNIADNEARGISLLGTANNIQFINCNIRNIKTTYTYACPFRASGTGATSINNIVLDGCVFYDNDVGTSETCTFEGYCENCEVRNCEITSKTPVDFCGRSGVNSDINKDFPRNCAARDNYFHDTPLGGGYSDGADNITFERNRFVNIDFALEVSNEHFGTSSSGNILRDNILEDCGTAIMVGGCSSSYGVTNNTTITNNTVYNALYGICINNCDSTTIKNNIINATTAQIFSWYFNATNTVIDYNDWNGSTIFYWNGNTYTTFSSWKTGTGFDVHSITGDPLFVNTGSAPNLRLQSGSPCVNTGAPDFVPGTGETDKDKNPRVNGIVDMGAYEYFISAVDGSAQEWSNIGAIATATGQHAISLKAASDATRILFCIQGSSLAPYYEIYINSDNNAATGFTGQGGADYMIENGSLFRHVGDDSSWNWTYVAAVVSSANGSVIEVSVSKAALTNLAGTVRVAYLGFASGFVFDCSLPVSGAHPAITVNIAVDGIATDWNDVTAIATATGQHAASLKAASDASRIFFCIQGSNLAPNYLIYINSDNASTGFWPEGDDYVIQSGALYKHVGNYESWTWTYVAADVVSSANGSVIEVSVNKAALTNLAGTARVGYYGYTTGWALDCYLPVSGMRPSFSANQP
jgi:parallel beta-helix repeat protein